MKQRVVILFLLGLAAVLCRPHRDIGYLHHVRMVLQFTCRVPQLRAIPVEELLTVGPSPDEQFYPVSTVLARCDLHSGCCQRGQICAPAETRNVSLVFTVTHVVDTTRDRHHEVIHAVNHTRCHCVDERIPTMGYEVENLLKPIANEAT